MTAYYTLSQYQAQARVLEAMIAEEDRRLANLDKLPEDVREAHARTINMRRNSQIERLHGLRIKMNGMEQPK